MPIHMYTVETLLGEQLSSVIGRTRPYEEGEKLVVEEREWTIVRIDEPDGTSAPKLPKLVVA